MGLIIGDEGYGETSVVAVKLGSETVNKIYCGSDLVWNTGDNGEIQGSGSWSQLGSDIDGDANADRLGSAVAVSSDGLTFAAGAPGTNSGGSGHVKVFRYSSGSWSQLGSDIDGQSSGDESGTAVAISSDGETVAISSQNSDDGGSNVGHVRVFEYSSGSWSQVGGNISGEAADDYLGEAIALSSDGSIVAIGTTLNDGGGSYSGHVRVFQYSSGSWSQLGSDIDGEAGDLSGSSVALSSDGLTVAVGADRADGGGSNAGRVRVFQYSSGSWSQLGSDIDGEAGDLSGRSVALSSDGLTVAIGAPSNDDGGLYAGSVRVFEYSSGSWSQVGGDILGENSGDYFGYSVALSSDGSIFAAGSLLNDGGGSYSGHVRVFQYSSGSWSQLGSDIDGEAAEDRAYTVGISSDGSIVAIGAPLNDDGGLSAGSVRVFEYSSSGGGGSGSSSGTSWSLSHSSYNNGQHDNFGQSVSLSADGDTLAVSAVYDDDAGVQAGRVDVFDITGILTTVGTSILGQATGDQAGYTIDLNDDGTILAIGANTANSGSLPNNGEIRIFEYSSGSWSQLGSDIVGDAVNDQFAEVQINSDGTRVVCSSWKHESGSNYGQVKVFEYSSGSWSQLGSDLEGTTEQKFGFSISINSDGDRIAVGSPFYTEGSHNATGKVQVYDWNGSSWSQVGSTITGSSNGEQFGYAVSLNANGNRLAISAPYGGTAKVEVYEYSSGSWSQLGSDINYSGNTANTASFGWKLAFNAAGNRLAISAPYESTSTTNAGTVRVFDLDGTSWSLAGSMIDGENADDKFGWSVALSSSGNTLAVGAIHVDTGASNGGMVYVYEWE